MKNWVSRIRAAIRNINRKKDTKPGDTSGPSSSHTKMEAASNEPEYASIKDYPRFVSRVHFRMIKILISVCDQAAPQ